jgi:hypothetical protein
MDFWSGDPAAASMAMKFPVLLLGLKEEQSNGPMGIS